MVDHFKLNNDFKAQVAAAQETLNIKLVRAALAWIAENRPIHQERFPDEILAYSFRS